MLAEAQGNTVTSVGYINQVRVRAGLSAIASPQPTVAAFEQELSNECRREFSFENQRWFDLLRFNTTLTTITAEQTIKNHFAYEYAAHYSGYLAPVLTLAQLQGNVTANRLLLQIKKVLPLIVWEPFIV